MRMHVDQTNRHHHGLTLDTVESAPAFIPACATISTMRASNRDGLL